ncbi:MAG: NAD-dependent epimerase/dehydratase family protein [Acidimicrobiales bacterium]
MLLASVSAEDEHPTCLATPGQNVGARFPRGGVPVRALVTGGAGFIGSHLCEAMLRREWSVVCVDDLSTGSRSNVTYLEELGGKRFLAVIEDLSAGAWEPMAGEGAFDLVFHLASAASPPDYLAMPLQTLAVGSTGTWRAVEFAYQRGARFIFTSTSEVYGDPMVHPQKESYWGNVNPVGPRSVYDEGKRFSEALTMARYRELDQSVGIARLFNTYGPRMRPGDGRVLSNFVEQALTGKPLTIYGDGSQTRSPCYVSDLVTGLIALGDSSLIGPVNLGNPQEVTVLELAHAVIEATGSSSPVEFGPLPEDDPKRRCPDISLAGRELGWSPSVTLHDGLIMFIDWVRVQLGKGVIG